MAVPGQERQRRLGIVDGHDRQFRFHPVLYGFQSAYGKFHKFEIRGVNAAGGGRASKTLKVALMKASYSASSYEAIEGGAAVQVTVRLSPGVDRPVSIPLTLTDVDAESGDYTVSGLAAGSLSFRAGDNSKRFAITAVSDAEEVTLGLGALPSGVTAGFRPRRRCTCANPRRRRRAEYRRGRSRGCRPVRTRPGRFS